MRSVQWATNYAGMANSFGYSVHNNRARQALEATGVRIEDSAPVALHVTPPHRFFAIPGKVNVAYIAWEAYELPDLFRERLIFADAVCVTAKYLLEPMRKILPDKRVYYVPEGVDFERYKFVDRTTKDRRPIAQPKRRGGRPFRFLWVGAPNDRKGPKHVLAAWKALKPGGPLYDEVGKHCELYIKTTVKPDSKAYVGIVRGGDKTPDGRVVEEENVIYDTRKLSIDDLAELYGSAHCFLFPSVGEGFGLTFAEALATGLPSIYTAETAMLDLAPPDLKLAYPVKFGWTPNRWYWPNADGYGTEMEVHVRLPNAEITDLAVQMAYVATHYQQALERGRRAAEYVKRFTWEECGRLLREVVETVSAPAEGSRAA